MWLIGAAGEGTSNAARRERSVANDHVSEGQHQEESKLKDDEGDGLVQGKHDERTESRVLRATGKSPRSPSLSQASGTRSLSADSSL